MSKRYSKKRESILKCLKSTTEHPSAEKIYAELKPKHPDLSLGTVYRNLNMLVNEGSVCSVGVVNDKERFDARTEPHVHAICERCGKILDVEDISLPDEMLEAVQKSTGFALTYSRLQFMGLCADCKTAVQKGIYSKNV